MKAISLMYHDIVTSKADIDSSGFNSPDANHYKVDSVDFSKHLSKIYSDNKFVSTFKSKAGSVNTPIFLTFDDGGKSAILEARTVLNKFNAKGHFFITTSMIGEPNFLTEEDIIQLDQEGHIIGSHSHTHPLKISALKPNEIKNEWKCSIETLQKILKKEITVASIPGGFYSNEVVEFASKCGIKTLFTSEPKRSFSNLYGCNLIGRYTVVRNTPLSNIEKIYQENDLFLFKQFAFWELKKILKKYFGSQYAALRILIFKYIKRK
jgi:peptidoglycan/xylan/chitin deacetylase (PgdA/CDA1 family)